LVYVAHLNWTRGQVYIHLDVMALDFAAYLWGFILLAFALTNYRKTMEHGTKIIFYSLVFLLIFNTYVYVTAVMQMYGTDAIAFSHYAAELFLQGRNPYTQDLVPALEKFNVPLYFLTPTISGGWISNMTYPALHFLIFVPFVLIGLSDMRWVVFFFHLATIVIIYSVSPKKLKPLTLIPLFAFPNLMDFTGGGVTDFLWTLPIVLMALYMEDLNKSAIFFGLACSIKQTPWMLAPFIPIWFWKKKEHLPVRLRLIEIGKFASIVAATFLITNLYFIIINPTAWFYGAFSPMLGGLIPFGHGLSTLTQAGAVSLSEIFFTVCVIAVMILLLVYYCIHFDKLEYAVWIFPAIILWFSYRSLQNYFIFWIPPLVISFIKWYDNWVEKKETLSAN